MKIAVTALENHLNSRITPRFGRAPFFILIDSETEEFEVLANANVDGQGGVGIQSAQLLIENDVKAVLTGRCGPNAFRVLQASEVFVYENVSGTVKEVLQKFRNNMLKPAEPSEEGQFSDRHSPTEKPVISSSNAVKQEDQIHLVKKEIKNMEVRLQELNKKLDDMSRNNTSRDQMTDSDKI